MKFYRYQCLYCGRVFLLTRKRSDFRCENCSHGLVFIGMIEKTKREIEELIEQAR